MKTQNIFRIPNLDALTESISPHVGNNHRKVICVQGPVGSGKSTLCLHAASAFVHNIELKSPRVIFVSTDLRFAEANQTWMDFDLHRTPPWIKAKRAQIIQMIELSLTSENSSPSGAQPLAKWLALSKLPKSMACGFVDLSSVSLGDEWGFVERLLAAVRSEPSERVELMIVLDSLSGVDALSVRGTKRDSIPTQEHINRLIPLLGTSINFLFTARKDDPTALLIREEAQADIAYELGFRQLCGVAQRTIRVIKARTFHHPSEEHIIYLRSHRTYSAGKLDLDLNRKGFPKSFIDVVPSIAWLETVSKRGPADDDVASKRTRLSEPVSPLCAFGIQHLDPMLAGWSTSDLDSPIGRILTQGDTFGIPAGTSVSIIGPSRTFKSELAMSFLRYGFAYSARMLMTLLDALNESSSKRAYPQGEAGEFCRIRSLLSAWGAKALGTAGESIQVLNHKLCALVDEEPNFAKHSANLANSVLGRCKMVGRVKNAKLLPILTAALGLLHLPQFRRYALLITHHRRDHSLMVNEFAKHLASHYRQNIAIVGKSYLKKQLVESDEEFRVMFESLLIQVISGSLFYRQMGSSELYPSLVIHALRRYVHACASDIRDYSRFLLPSSKLNQNARRYLNEAFWFSPRGWANTGDGETNNSFNRINEVLWESNPKYDFCIQRQPIGNIRLVIDDLCEFTGESSQQADTFGRLLGEYLGRNGITGVLVDTCKEHNSPGENGYNSRSDAVTKQVIRCRRIRFAQGERVAFTVDPPFNDELGTIARELKMSPQEGRNVLYVDPNLELYSHLEAGRPTLLPLEIRLFSETAGCERYIVKETPFLGQILGTGNNDSGVSSISVRNVAICDYYLLQKLCTTPHLAVGDRTVVVQVDGYWNLDRNGDLRSMHQYLTRSLRFIPTTTTDFEDQFGAFKRKWAAQVIGSASDYPYDNRLEYFQIEHSRHTESGAPSARAYRTRIRSDDTRMDRVPYTWDFGFLLLRRDIYDWCLKEPQSNLLVEEDSEQRLGQVIKALTNLDGIEQPRINLSWYAFLRTLQTVAMQWRRVSGEPVPLLGLAQGSPDSIDTLTLEIWFSEIVLRLEKTRGNGHFLQKFLRAFSADEFVDYSNSRERTKTPGQGGLIELLGYQQISLSELATQYLESLTRKSSTKDRYDRQFAKRTGYFLELYKTWLLLCDVLVAGGDLNPADAADRTKTGLITKCLAVRHWYKTGCSATNSGLNPQLAESQSYVASKLPGRFSVRGDWYLGVLRSSASPRLGQLTIDILSTVDAVRRRLDCGVGLPVIDLRSNYPGRKAELIGTALHAARNGSVRPLSLDEVMALGVVPSDFHVANPKFNWLWRSGIAGFDLQAEVFRRWLRASIGWTVELRTSLGSDWMSGLDLYRVIQKEGLRGLPKTSTTDPRSIVEFAARCDALISELRVT